jgi:rhodanese-related sulfurtransferase
MHNMDTQDLPLAVNLAHAKAESDAGRAVLIDVREPHEHATGVAPGALLMPLSTLGEHVHELPDNAAVPLMFICRTQQRSAMVANALRQRGMAHAQFVQGGMSQWAQMGWAMVAMPAS